MVLFLSEASHKSREVLELLRVGEGRVTPPFNSDLEKNNLPRNFYFLLKLFQSSTHRGHGGVLAGQLKQYSKRC